MIITLIQLFVAACNKSLENGDITGALIVERDPERRRELKRRFRKTGLELLVSLFHVLFGIVKLGLAVYFGILLVYKYLIASVWAIFWANGKFLCIFDREVSSPVLKLCFFVKSNLLI